MYTCKMYWHINTTLFLKYIFIVLLPASKYLINVFFKSFCWLLFFIVLALDIVAALMEKGEVCQVKTDHRYAYGAVGRSVQVFSNIQQERLLHIASLSLAFGIEQAQPDNLALCSQQVEE